MDPLNLKKLNVAVKERRAAILLTEMATGRDRIIHQGETVSGEIGAEVEKGFRNGKSTMVSIKDGDYFLNVHVPPPRLVVIGAVHISQALASLAALSEYQLEIIDPRTAFATPERFAGVDLYADWPQEILKKRPLDAYSALVAVTHDPKIDDYPLQAALEAGCFYVGALGSRKTHGKRMERLSAAGVSAAQLSRIHAPIGLDIGASSPQEIAIAIMAEIISDFRTRDTGPGEKTDNGDGQK